MVQRKAVHVQYLSTHEQVANVFTKLLARMKFKYFHERLGLVENASLAERECWWLQLHETFSRSYSSRLSWDDLWEHLCDRWVVLLWNELRWSVRNPMCWVCPCDGCVSDSGLSCDDVWSLVYSSELSWNDLRWSPALYSSGLRWVGLRWSSTLYSYGLKKYYQLNDNFVKFSFFQGSHFLPHF